MNFFKMINERRCRRKELEALLETKEETERRERIKKEICKTCEFGKVVVLKHDLFTDVYGETTYDTEEKVVCMLKVACDHYVEKEERDGH